MADQIQTRATNALNTFHKGMHSDALDSQVPSGYYRNMHNGVIETEEEHSFGVSAEASNEIFAALPEGATIRGFHLLEEKDYFVFFLNIGGKSEIGYVDGNTKEYVTVFDRCQDVLDFGMDTWIPITSKTLPHCAEIHLFWAVGDYYYKLNFTNPDEVKICDDLYLFQPNCVSPLRCTASSKGGRDLYGGAYDIVVRLKDEDGNLTNWFNFSEDTIYLGTENNKASEQTDQGIHISIDHLGDDYTEVEIGVFHNGNVTGSKIASIPYSTNGVEYFYSSRNQHISDIDIADVLTKRNGYIRGADLIPYDGRLFLYNVRGERNLDYQERALNIKPSYVIGRVPMKYSHMFKGLRGGETYAVSIHWNFVDGTRTKEFHIGNVDVEPASGEGCGCDGKNAGNNANRTSTEGLSSVEDDSAAGIWEKEGESEEYVRYVPTEQNNYSPDDADFPDYSDVPLPTEGGDDCDCQVICALGNAAKAVIYSALDGGTPDGGFASPTDILSSYQLIKKRCECNCDGDGVGLRESTSSLTFNDADVAKLHKKLELEEQVAGGTLTKASVQEYLELFYDYDADGGSLEDNLEVELRGYEEGLTDEEDDSNCFEEGPTTGEDPYGEDGGDSLTGDGEVSTRSTTPTGTGDDGGSGKICDDDTTTGGSQEPLDNFSNTATAEESNPSDNGTGTGVSTPSTGDQSVYDEVQNECEPEVIIKEGTCCEVEKVIPCIDAKGTLSGWESCETYPETKRCDSDEYIYGEWAGKGIRHLKMPSRDVEPHFIAYNQGVPSSDNRDNHESKNTYARFIWLELDNIEPPKDEEIDKPLCDENPFTVSIVKRDATNKSVIASGLVRGTFKGNIFGQTHLYPKHGVNSPETVSRWIENTDGEFRRLGRPNEDTPAYTFLSPDTAFDRPNIDGDRVDFLMSLYGRGERHGLYAEGARPDTFFTDTKHTKGARAAINLNHYSIEKSQACLKAASYAPADTLVDKGDGFSYDLVNLSRESSVYFETEDNYINQTDSSFIGDVNQHRRVLSGLGSYADFVREIPNQYGRLENLAYIPIYQGTAEDLSEGKCVVDNGDSFINLYSVKTSSYVSDRVGVNDDSKSIAPIFEFGGGLGNLPLIGGLAKRIFSTVGAETCGTIPNQGIQAAELDPRADNSLNGLRGEGASVSDLTSPPTRDTYFPHVQKTLVTFPVESDVNLHFRGGGETEETAHYRDLNGLQLDSSFGGGEGGYDDSYLDQYWATMSELSSGRQLLRVIVNFVFTYVVGYYFLIRGFVKGAETLEEIVVGTSSSVAAVFALVTSILLVILGFVWIWLWGNTNLDNKFWDRVLGIKDCFPDRFLTGDKYAMKDDRVRGFRDEFYYYEYESYSRINNFDYGLGLPSNYNTCDCLNEYTYDILYSNKQDPTSTRDAWRNFRTNNYKKLNPAKGRPTKMFTRSNRLYCQTTDTIYSLESGATKFVSQDGTEIYMGRGDAVQDPIDLFEGASEGFSGNLDPNGAINTKWGFIWIDREARKLYMFSNDLEELSGFTIRNFFRENLDFKFLDHFPDYPYVDEKIPNGIGYSLGVDHRHDRLLITKNDFAPKKGVEVSEFNVDGTCLINGQEVQVGDSQYFEDLSFTLSYSFPIKNFVSFHSYKPEFYMWDRHDMYTMGAEGMYIHNVNGSFRKFYGELQPWIINFTVHDEKTLDAVEYQNTTIYSESSVYDGETYVTGSKFPFEEVVVYNSFQSTGELEFKLESENILDNSKDYADTNLMPIHYLPQQAWRFNEVRNKLVDKDKRMFEPFNGNEPKQVSEDNIGEAKEDKFLDIYVGYILKFEGNEDEKLILKRVVTNADTENM